MAYQFKQKQKYFVELRITTTAFSSFTTLPSLCRKSICFRERRLLGISPTQTRKGAIATIEKMLAKLSQDMISLVEGVGVYDLNRNAVPLTDLWKGRKAVVGFTQQFGCVLCYKRVDIHTS